METRNIAIMLTDIKGFTAKTASFSRAQTQEMLSKHRELVLPVIERFGGRLVKTIGDAFLAAFNSPTDAVICGVEIQNVLRSYNDGRPQPEKIEIRIAINSGEVAIHDDGDIYGDAVNITARLESIAEAGEVFFTEAVYLTMNKKEVPSSEIGYRQFKGVPEKIKVFRVLREVPVGSQPPGEVEPAPDVPAPAALKTTAVPAPAALVPAGIPLKAAALVLDILLFGIVASFFSRRGSIFGAGGLLRSDLPVKALFWVLYAAIFLKRKGATAGMLIMKLRLIDLSTGQTPKRALWRAVFGLVSAVPFGLGYFWAFFEKDKRTWHDLISGTLIVKA